MNSSSINHPSVSVHAQLYMLVHNNRPYELHAYLCQIPNCVQHLITIYYFNDEYLTLLMLAALNGYEEVVSILISHSGKMYQVEQEGCIRQSDGILIPHTTALWCALHRGNFHVARILITQGKANINHGPNNPLLIDASACGRLDIVKFLVENGYVDVNQIVSNDEHARSSLLTAAAEGYPKIVDYLISRGADLEHRSRVSGDTPLSAAAMIGDFSSIRLLCWAGACLDVMNSSGKTPLGILADNNYSDIVSFLLACKHDAANFDDLELVATEKILTSHYNQQQAAESMLSLLRISLDKRHLFNVPKQINEPVSGYEFHQECQSIDELNKIQHDLDSLHIEALLIRERILRPRKKNSIFDPLLNRAILLAERKQFDRCLQLMIHTLYLYQEMEQRTCLHRFVWMFCKMLADQVIIPVNQFLQACNLLFEPSQRNSFDDNTMKNAVYLMVIATKVNVHVFSLISVRIV